MATLAALKKKIADLEAQVEKVTRAEMGSAIAKVRKIMADFGLTVEHLVEGATGGKTSAKKRASLKAAKKQKGSKPAKYRDPATGVTWSGVGRAPAWIASAKNRDEYLIAKPESADDSERATAVAKKATRRAVAAKGGKGAKTAAVAKKNASKVSVLAKRVAKAVSPKPASKKAVAKKAAPKKVAAKKVAGKATRKKAAPKGATAPAASNGASAEASST